MGRGVPQMSGEAMTPQPNHSPLESVVHRLGDAGCNPRAIGGQWTAKCPVQANHKRGDKNPSLSIGEGPDGKVLLHCHTGCTVPDIARALDLRLVDLFPDKPPSVAHISGGKRVKAEYNYYDADGTLVFQVVRFEPKTFRQRQPNGADWVWNLHGITHRPLYMLPQVRAAIAAGKPVWIVEGEKDAENLQWEVDGAVTCNSGGAGKWSGEYDLQLDGATDIRIIADNDPVGLDHARHVARSLYDHGHQVIGVRHPPDSFKDISEAFAAGKTIDDLVPVWNTKHGREWLDGAEPEQPEAAEAAQAEVRNDLLAQLVDWREFWAHDHGSEEWIAWPLIPAGRGVALYAPAKTGKSIVLLAVCAALATGRSVLGAPPQPPRSVLLLDYEMTASDLQERLEALGYTADDDLSNLHYALLPSLPPLNTIAGRDAVVELAALVDAEVVIIDTLGRAVTGEENSSDTYKEFARLTGIALKAAGRSVLRTDHAGKSKEQGQRGSSAKNDDVDVVFRLDAAEDGWTLTRTHSRISWVPEKVAINSSEDAEGRRIFTADRAKRTYLPGTKELADRLRSLGITGMDSRREAHAVLVQQGEAVRAKRLGDALAWMRVEEGSLLSNAIRPVDNLGTTMGTTSGTTFSASEGTTSGTTKDDMQTTRSEYGNHDGNQAEPESDPGGNHPPLRSKGVVPGEPADVDPSTTINDEGLFR